MRNAISLFCELGRFGTAGNLQVEVAELYEQDRNWEEALEQFRQASDYFTGDGRALQADQVATDNPTDPTDNPTNPTMMSRDENGGGGSVIARADEESGGPCSAGARERRSFERRTAWVASPFLGKRHRRR